MTPRMLAWQQFVRVVLVLTAFFAVAGSVHAQLPPDQRRQMRQEMREQWQQMPQEDRQRMRDEMRGRRDEAGGQGMRQGGGFRGGRP